MTRSYWTAAAAAIVAFGIGVMISAGASGQSDPQLAVLQQIEKNTETTNAQLATLNQQIAKLATSLNALSAAAVRQPGTSSQVPNSPPRN